MDDPLSVPGLEVVNMPVSQGLECRPGTQRKIKTVVIHETANTAVGANAEAHGRYLAGGGSGTTGWHYTVDDQKAVHHIPDAEVAYHSGSTEGNRDGIGIEICVNEDGDFDKAMDNAAKLTAALLNRYGLTVDDVRQHHDYMEKNCPATIRDSGRWDEFLALTEKYAANAAE